MSPNVGDRKRQKNIGCYPHPRFRNERHGHDIASHQRRVLHYEVRSDSALPLRVQPRVAGLPARDHDNVQLDLAGRDASGSQTGRHRAQRDDQTNPEDQRDGTAKHFFALLQR